jgi:hypothetical protein
MKARFIGDPAEREGGKPLSRDAGEWFEVVDPAHFAKLSNNAHYEIEGVAIIGAKPAPKRTRAAKPAPKIETDGWEDGE